MKSWNEESERGGREHEKACNVENGSLINQGVEVLQFHFSLDPNPELESPKG